jgi:hypothetical protein
MTSKTAALGETSPDESKALKGRNKPLDSNCLALSGLCAAFISYPGRRPCSQNSHQPCPGLIC